MILIKELKVHVNILHFFGFQKYYKDQEIHSITRLSQQLKNCSV